MTVGLLAFFQGGLGGNVLILLDVLFDVDFIEGEVFLLAG